MVGMIFEKTAFWFKFKNELKPGDSPGLNLFLNLNQSCYWFKFIFELKPGDSPGLSSFLNLNQQLVFPKILPTHVFLLQLCPLKAL